MTLSGVRDFAATALMASTPDVQVASSSATLQPQAAQTSGKASRIKI